jgi:hypothetical protein
MLISQGVGIVTKNEGSEGVKYTPENETSATRGLKKKIECWHGFCFFDGWHGSCQESRVLPGTYLEYGYGQRPFRPPVVDFFHFRVPY